MRECVLISSEEYRLRVITEDQYEAEGKGK